MSLLHAFVSRGAQILCEHSQSPTPQNFSSAASTILSKIPQNNSKLSYAVGDAFHFHYIAQDGLVTMVVADESLPRRIAFAFLSEIQKSFRANYSQADIDAASPYGMKHFEQNLSKMMHQYNTNPPADPIKQAQAEIADTRAIMVQNVEAILSRGERIELLVDKTDAMTHQARAFRKRSQALRRQMWYRNMKLILLTGFIVVMLIYLLIASQCGPGMNHCTR